MNLDDVRRVLAYRRSLTDQPFGDEKVYDWLDVLRPFNADTARAAIARLARLSDKVSLRDIVSAIDPQGASPPRVEALGSIGDAGCFECDGCGFSPSDEDPSRLAPCSLCSPDRRAAVDERSRAILRAEEARLARVASDIVDPIHGRAIAEQARARAVAAKKDATRRP